MFGKKQQRVVCQYCNKEVSVNTFNIWHGDNCCVVNPNSKTKQKTETAVLTILCMGKNKKLKNVSVVAKKCRHRTMLVGMAKNAKVI